MILDGSSVVQILKGAGASTVQGAVLKRYVIYTFCAVDRVDLVCSTC